MSRDKWKAKYQYFAQVRDRRKIKAVEYKGGACQHCGYNRCIEALEFHHLDETTKSFPIGSRMASYTWDRLREELDKCIMLCANCHRELHSGVNG